MPEDLKHISDLGQQVLNLEYEILNLEAQLKEKRKQHRYLTEFVLPDATDSLEWDPKRMSYEPAGDIVTINLLNGHVMAIAEEFHPHTPKKDVEKRGEILDWVEKNGGEDLLTLDLTLSFRRGEGKLARQVLAALDAIPGINYTKEKGIHHSNYQTFCRDRIRAGLDLPELLGVFNRRVAKVAETQHSEVRPEHGVPEWTKDEPVTAKNHGQVPIKTDVGYGE